MRVILTALMVLWLLVGCATSEEPDATVPSPRDTYLSFCPDVMHEISRYHDGFDRLVDTDDPADFDQVRSASLRIAGPAEWASRRVTGPGAVSSQDPSAMIEPSSLIATDFPVSVLLEVPTMSSPICGQSSVAANAGDVEYERGARISVATNSAVR